MSICDQQFAHVGSNYGKFNPDTDVTITKYAHGNDGRVSKTLIYSQYAKRYTFLDLLRIFSMRGLEYTKVLNRIPFSSSEEADQ